MDRERTDDQTGLSTAYQTRSVAEAWQRGAAARAGTLGPLTEAMLDLADVMPGARVLDVAAGTGEQTIMAARRVGPGGYVLAVDISPEMLGEPPRRSAPPGCRTSRRWCETPRRSTCIPTRSTRRSVAAG